MGWNPLAAARRRFQAWFESRLPRQDSCTLTQRNVYILPTAPGWMLALTLLVLLVASINYQLNLGYLLTFMLAGAALVGMHVSHGNLRGLTMYLIAPAALFSGASASLDIQISNPGTRSRFGLALAVLRSGQWVWTDVGPQGSTQVKVRFQAPTRGWHATPALTAETRFPLGTFRVWTVWHPASKVLVYPAPEPSPPPLPIGEPGANEDHPVQHPAQRHSSGELDGLRAYRRGDPRKQIVWKKAAKSDALVSRDTEEAQPLELWLDLAATVHTLRSLPDPDGAATQEWALSRLCAWVLQAESLGLRYGLRLGAQVLPPDSGPAHQQRCLQALALA